MNTDTIDSEKNSNPEREAATAKGKRTTAKKTKPVRKAGRAKKSAGNPKADRANKKAEVIAMMKRAKGATLAEIVAATKWQAHTVRGFGSLLGSKGGVKVESSKNAAGERTYKLCGAPHKRHCYATHWLESGGDLVALQKLLRHVKLEDTVKYLHLSRRHLQSVANPWIVWR